MVIRKLIVFNLELQEVRVFGVGMQRFLRVTLEEVSRLVLLLYWSFQVGIKLLFRSLLRVKELNIQIVVDLIVFAIRVNILTHNTEFFGLVALVF